MLDNIKYEIIILFKDLKVKEYPVQMTGVSLAIRIKNKLARKN